MQPEAYTKKLKIPDEAGEVLNNLKAAGYEAFVVGGCVRDTLLGKKPKDWDICCNAAPERVIELFGEKNTIPTGLQHGTVSVKGKSDIFEVTTFRSDGNYSDGRHPDKVNFVGSIEEDLARRDFTINAMAFSEETGLVDPFGGLEDCANRVIRAVGNPDMRFQEDALRMLRAMRFSAQLGFTIEQNTLLAIGRNVQRLTKISKERIGAEILKTVKAPYATHGILQDGGKLISFVIPELAACQKCEQKNQYHYLNVFDHIMAALSNTTAQEQVFPKEWTDDYVCMALLLHDIGKPLVKTTDEDGHDHFYGHASVSGELAEQVLKRLRYSNEFTKSVKELIDAHGTVFTPSRSCVKRLLNKYGVVQLRRLLKIRECDNKAHTLAARPRFVENTIPFSELLEQVLLENEAFTLKDLAINGNDLKKIGISPGPEMGKVLNFLLESVLDGTENDKDTLVSLAKLAAG